MNLEDANIASQPPIQEPPLVVPETIIIKADVVADSDDTDEDSTGVCLRCLVEGSKSLPNGTCDVCGAVWESSDDDDGDFEISLELLKQATELITQLLANRKIVHKMTYQNETAARLLVVTIDDFLDTYDFSVDA